MPSGSFIGPSLSLENLTLFNLTSLRVKFSQYVLASSPVGVHDALNPSNYTITGPGVTFVSSVTPVATDPQSVDLTLGIALVAGTWTLSVANIQTPEGSGLFPPTSLPFTASSVQPAPPISNGAQDETALDVLKKHMGGGLNLNGPGWNSVLTGLSAGDQYNFDTAKLAFNERFVASADDIYLDYLGSAEGIDRPPDLGMTDELYSDLVIKLTSHKLTEESFLELLEIFYGPDAVKAHIVSTEFEPYGITDLDTISFLINQRQTAIITFYDDDFEVPAVAKAIEVAAAITRDMQQQGINAYAIPFADPLTGQNAVKVYSAARGGVSSISCTGGIAQNILRFPTVRVLADTSGTWSIQPVTGLINTARFTTSGATTVDLTQVIAGDYVNIFGPSFAPQNRGTFTITNVGVSYPGGILTQFFDIINNHFVNQSSVGISSETDLTIFTPTKETSFTTVGRSVVVSSNGPNEVDVVIPATTQAVSRHVGEAAYLQAPLVIFPSLIERLGDGTVKLTATGHGLTNSTSAFIDGIKWNNTAATINTGSPSVSGSPGTSPSTLGAGPLNLRNLDSSGAYFIPSIQLLDGRILLAGGNTSGAPSNQAQLMSISLSGTAGDGSLSYTYNYLPSTPITWTGRQDLFSSAAKVLQIGANFGDVLFIGGATNASGAGAYTNTTDLFTPSGPAFTAGPTMSVVRGEFGCDTLQDDRIIVSGGRATNVATTANKVTEIYDPNTNTFTTKANMLSTRNGHTLTTLASGKVLAAGGVQGTSSTPCQPNSEVYDVGGNTWTKTGGMCIPRQGHQSILLPDGTVLALGGTSLVGNPALQTEIYNPTTGIWELGPTCLIPLVSCQAFLDTPNNRVLAYASNRLAILNLANFEWTVSTALLPTDAGAVYNPTTGFIILAGQLSGLSALPTATLVPTLNSSTSAIGLSSGELGGFHQLSIFDPNTLLYSVSPGSFFTFNNSSDQVTAILSKAPSGLFPGPFVYNTVDGPAITGTSTTTSLSYSKGVQYNTITVASTTEFPDKPGFLCLGFGFNYQVNPIPYLGVLDPTNLLVDFSFKFTQDVPVGASVTLLNGKGPFIPTSTQAETAGSFYVTDSAAGHVAAENAIADAQAAGVNVNVTIQYPGDRGLGAEGFPDKGANKLSDIVGVFAGNNEDAEIQAAREE